MPARISSPLIQKFEELISQFFDANPSPIESLYMEERLLDLFSYLEHRQHIAEDEE